MTSLSFLGEKRLLHISIGQTVSSNCVETKKVPWPEFKKALLKCKRTAETMAEYKRMSKETRDAIKDVGHYVLGPFEDNKRRKVNLMRVEGIVLDADHVGNDPHWMEKVKKAYKGLEYTCTTTHSHDAEAVKFRIMFPSRRTIVKDEYEAVGRSLADRLPINWFDDTGFQFARVMHFPSASKDAEFIAFSGSDDGQKVRFFDPDEELNKYFDWHDVSEWPMADNISKRLVKTADKAEDPTTKRGVVGAFCRVHGIHAVIEKFLPDIYTEGATPDRFTYTKGSKSNGAVVYDDMFLYSHHESDPASGMACNAFDLVRLHRYGELDDGKKEGASPTSLASYKAMAAWVNDLPEVRAELLASRRPLDFEPLEEQPKAVSTTADDFGLFEDLDAGEPDMLDITGLPGAEPELSESDPFGLYDDGVWRLTQDGYVLCMVRDTSMHVPEPRNCKKEPGWYVQLLKSLNMVGVQNPEIDRSSLDNVVKILNHDHILKLVFAYNDFTRARVMVRDFRGNVVTDKINGDPWRDEFDLQIKHYIEGNYNLIVSVALLNEGLSLVCGSRKFHPIRDLLTGRMNKWDGKKRLHSWLEMCVGVENSAYHREVSIKFFVQMVSRIMNPGCKADHMLVLEGQQGIGKSTLCRYLGLGFHSDSMSFGMDEQKVIERTRSGVAIAEISELITKGAASVEHNKHFITRQVDRSRAAYGRNLESVPRQFVIVGTTNDDTWLADTTGGRRYWPVECQTISLDWLKQNVLLLWAEAYAMWRDGAQNYIDDKEAAGQATEAQAARLFDDEITDRLVAFLALPIPYDYWESGAYRESGKLKPGHFEDDALKMERRNKCTRKELWVRALGRDEKDFNRTASFQITAAMKKIKDWKPSVGLTLCEGVRTRGYIRIRGK